MVESTGDDIEGDVSSVMDSARRNRQLSLQEMFTEVDVSGELLENITNPSVDPIRQKREQRANSMSLILDPAG